MPAHLPPESPDGAPAPQQRPDLSSIPAEYIQSGPGVTAKARLRETPEERAERYRRKRRAQVIGVLVFSVLLLVVVLGVALFNQMSSKSTSQTTADSVCSAPMTPADPKGVTVDVFNMTSKPGMASSIGDKLKERGFSIGKVGNHAGPFSMPARTSVTAVIKSNDTAQKEALTLQRQLTNSVYQEDKSMKGKRVAVYLIDQTADLAPEVDTSEGGLICK